MTNYRKLNEADVLDLIKLRDKAHGSCHRRLIENITLLTHHEDCEPILKALLGENPPTAMLASNLAARAAIQDGLMLALSEQFQSNADIEWAYVEVRDKRWAIYVDDPTMDIKARNGHFSPFKKAFSNFLGMTHLKVETINGRAMLCHGVRGIAWAPNMLKQAKTQIIKTRRKLQPVDGYESILMERIETVRELTAAILQTFDMTVGYSPDWEKPAKHKHLKKKDEARRLLELSMVHILGSTTIRPLTLDGGDGNPILKGVLTANESRVRRNKEPSPIHIDCMPHALLVLGQETWGEAYQLPRVIRR